MDSEPTAGNLKSSATRAKRAPLAGAALAVVGGIVAGRYAQVSLGFWMVCCVAALLVAAVSFHRKHLHLVTAWALGAAIFAVAAGYLQVAHFRAPVDHIVTYSADRSILTTVRGRIVTSPMRFSDTIEFGYKRPDQTGFVLQAERIATDGHWRPVEGLVRVTIREPAEHLAAGQRVELVGRIGRFRPPANPGQFDHAAAARRNGTLVWISVPGADGATILDGSQRPWHRRIYWNFRAAARQHIAGLAATQDARLLSALIIGERHPALAKLNRTMARAGIAHFLSISGMHLAVFLGFVYLLCRLVVLSPRRSAAIVLIVLGAYLLLAEPRAPLLRSAMMAAALCVATISRRDCSSLNALSAAAIVLLAIDPMQLFSPGFQLSFAIVIGIILLHRPVLGLLFGRWRARRGLIVFRTDQTFRRWASYRLSDWLLKAFVIALVAYATAAPLVAYHFGLFTPYAIVLSMLLFPLVAMVLIPGYVSMALLWPLPGLSYTLGRAAGWAAELLARAVGTLSVLPGMSLELRQLPAGWVAMCYLVLVLLVFARRVPLGRILACVAVAVLAGWTVVSQLPAPHPAVAELHLLAVGSGQCAILRTPSGKTYILDAGTQSAYDACRQVLRPAILGQRLPEPREAFVSHANTDHFNALPEMIRAGTIERVYLNDYFTRRTPGPSYDESPAAGFIRSLQDANVQIVRLRAGLSIDLDERTKVDVLWPPAGKPRDLSVNDTSLVLRVTCDDRSVLLAGDLGERGQRALLSEPKLNVDVLVMPHHGGWEPSLPEFFDAASPEVVLVSGSRDPRGAPAGGATRPATSVRTDFYDRMYRSSRYYSTAGDGWIRVRFGRGRVDVQTMRALRAGVASTRP